jgi:hypothetical protein
MSDVQSLDMSRVSIMDAAAGPQGAKRLLAFFCTDAPADSLARAQRSSDWVERAAVAMHATTPIAIVERLTGDGNAHVRALAREALARRGGTNG